MNLAFKSLLTILLICWLSWPSFAFSFAVFGDNRDGEPTYRRILQSVKSDPAIAFAVNTGDFVGRGEKEQYLAYRQLLKDFPVKIYHVPGNHDLVWGGWRYFTKYFGDYYYSFDQGNSHFIVLNNAFRESFDARQFRWLKKDLAGTSQANIFVFMHKPTFDPSKLYADYIMSGRKVTEELMALFTKYRVKYVFAGHLHGYARAERDGVVYIVTAGGGAPLYLPRDFGGFHHYVKITVDGEKITEQVVKIDG